MKIISTKSAHVFNYDSLDDYSFIDYNSLIKNSASNKMILDQLDEYDQDNPDEGHRYSLKCEDDNYGVAYDIYNEKGMPFEMTFKMNFNEFYRRYSILKEHGYIHVETYINDDDCIRDDDGNFIPHVYGALVVTKITK